MTVYNRKGININIFHLCNMGHDKLIDTEKNHVNYERSCH